jgi:carboxymethylenebutenolidase
MCMGGALSILAAIHVPEVDAVSCWYGVPPPEAGDPRSIRVPLQGHWALRDAYFPPAMVDALEASLRQGGVRYEFHRYEADHAFAHEGAPYYDRTAAELAWQRSLDFLAKHSG